jgi:hypothetical protein
MAKRHGMVIENEQREDGSPPGEIGHLDYTLFGRLNVFADARYVSKTNVWRGNYGTVC